MELATKENGKTINNTGLELRLGQMEQFMMDNIMRARKTEKEI
jgi:hypothetical protein